LTAILNDDFFNADFPIVIGIMIEMICMIFLLPIVFWPIYITYLSPITYHLAYCLLLIAFCSLLSAYCFLPIAYSYSPTNIPLPEQIQKWQCRHLKGLIATG
jgi:hypothetical protein